MNVRIFCLIALVLNLSCSNVSENESLRVLNVTANSYQDLNISDIASEVDIVDLELSDQSLLGDIIKVERSDQYIFVLHANGPKVLQFDLDGNFIKEMGKAGEGPEEYTRLITFSIDNKNKHIYLATLRKIVRYDFQNNFIDALSGLTFPEYTQFRNGSLEVYLTKTTPNTEKDELIRNSFVYRVQENKIVDSLLTKSISTQSKGFSIFPKAKYLSNSSQSSFFFQPILIPTLILSDTLFEIKNQELTPHLRLDFGDKTFDETGKKAIKIKSITRSDRFLLAEYLNNGERFFVYDFKTEKHYNLKYGIDGGKLTNNESVELFPLSNQPNMYYFTAHPESTTATFEPNPSVYFVSLKK